MLRHLLGDAEQLRGLARRARVVAMGVTHKTDIVRLSVYARSLEQRADELEQQAAAPHDAAHEAIAPDAKPL